MTCLPTCSSSSVSFLAFSRQSLDSPFLYASAQIPLSLSKSYRVVFVEPVYDSLIGVLRQRGIKAAFSSLWKCGEQKSDTLLCLSPIAFVPLRFGRFKALNEIFV